MAASLHSPDSLPDPGLPPILSLFPRPPRGFCAFVPHDSRILARNRTETLWFQRIIAIGARHAQGWTAALADPYSVAGDREAILENWLEDR